MNYSSLPVALLCLLFAPGPGQAHSGGTDASGCHNGPGGYHCHGGGGSSGGSSGFSPGFSGGSSGGSSPAPSGSYSDALRQMDIRVAPAPRPPSRARSTRPSRPPAALPPAGPVALVSQGDGDTIRVRDSRGQILTLRLACIDAPETAQGPSGAEARQTLAQLLQGRSLEIRPQTTDRYGWTVVEVFANGQNLNLEMVRLGAAFAYRGYLKGCDASAYLTAEQQAVQTRQGAWRWGDTVERPWEFRQSR